MDDQQSTDPYADIAKPVTSAAPAHSADPYADIARPISAAAQQQPPASPAAQPQQQAPAAPAAAKPSAPMPTGTSLDSFLDRDRNTPFRPNGGPSTSTPLLDSFTPPANPNDPGAVAAREFAKRAPTMALVNNRKDPVKTIGDYENQIAAGKHYESVAPTPIAQPGPVDTSYVQPDRSSASFKARQALDSFAYANNPDQLAHPGPDPLSSAAKGAFEGARDLSDAGYQARMGDKPDVNKALGGTAKIVEGGGTAALMAAAPELAGTLGTAVGVATTGAELAAKTAAQRAVATTVAHFVVGAGASAVTGKVADKLGASPEAKELAQALAFFVPSVMGVHAQLGVTSEGGTTGGFTIGAKTDPVTGQPVKGTGVAFVAGKTPDGVYGAGVKVGDNPTVGIKYGNQTPPPDAAGVTANNLLQGGIETMQEAQRAEAAADAIVQGANPVDAVKAQQPKAPPTMQQAAAAQMFSDRVIRPETMTAATEIIKALPPDQQAAKTLEAHGNLSAQIGQWVGQTFVGPDGKTYTVKNPQDADKFASQFINAQVDQHEAAIAAAQKPAQAPKPAQGQSKLQKGKEDQLYARAKTILESTGAQDGATPHAVLQQRLGVDPAKADALIQRYASEKTPTVGSSAPGQSVVEEKPATIDAQMDSLRAGTIKAVMLPAGSSYEPKLDAGMKKVVVSGDAPGAGTYIVKGISPQTVKEAAKAGTHGDLLGHVQTKEELAEAGTPTATVVAAKPDGTEIQASEVNNPQAAQAQAEVLAQRHPDAHISIKPTDQVVGERLAATEPNAPSTEGGDPFAAIAEPAEAEKPAETPAKAAEEPADPEWEKGLAEHRRDIDARADARTEAESRFQYQIDPHLWDALHRMAGSTGKWEKLRESGATDAQIAATMKPILGDGGTVDLDQRGGDKVYFRDPETGKKPKNPTLKGKELVGAARRLLNIGEPKAEAKAEPKPESQKPVKPDVKSAEPIERIPGVEGKETTVHTPSGEHKAVYRVVNAHDLIASHNYQTFKPDADYPKGVQERDYEKPEARKRVIDQATNHKPEYTVNSNPDAVNGPPIVTPDGIVLGGNSRTMSLQRLYHPSTKNNYRDYLREHAAEFGLKPEDVDGAHLNKVARSIYAPVLVREIEKPGSDEEMERVGSALNKSEMAPLSPTEKAVSAGRKIKPVTMDEISRLIDGAGENASVRDMLRESGPKALELLEQSGVLTQKEAHGYLDSGELSEAGKDFIENALLGSVVDDSKLMDAAPKAILNKLDGSLAAIAHIAAEPDEYNLIAVIRDAIEQHAEIAERRTNVDAFQKQSGLMEQRDVNPVVDAIARKLAEKPTIVKKTFRDFASDAKDGRLGQGSLLGDPPTAFEAFNERFGTTLTEEEYRHGVSRAISDEHPRRAEEGAERGDAGVSEKLPDDKEAASGRGDVAEPEQPGDGGQQLAEQPAEPASDEPEPQLGPTFKFQTAGIRPTRLPNGQISYVGEPEPPTWENHALSGYHVRQNDNDTFSVYKSGSSERFASGKTIEDAFRAGIKKLKAEGKEVPSTVRKEDLEPAAKPAVSPAISPAKSSAPKSDAAAPYSPKKEERVRYKTKDGQEKTGRFKATFGEGAVRIAPDGGGKPDVISKKNLLGPAEEKPAATTSSTSNDVEKPETSEKKVAESASNEETVGAHGDDRDTSAAASSDPADDEAGGGRPPARTDGAGADAVAEVPAGLLPGAQEGGRPGAGDQVDGLGVHQGFEPVSSERVEPGSGTGAGSGADKPTALAESPAAETIQQATKQLTKPVTLNKDWYAHPDNWQPPAGEVTRLDTNIAALKLVRELEKAPRQLNDDEKYALANYVGWGSLPHIFNPYGAPRDQQERWRRAATELRGLLSPDEMDAARKSTINAHYTSPDLVRFMWDALGRFGFKAGNVLEPSIGSGNFFGMMPKSIRGKVSAIGNEMDPMTHLIAQTLYPSAKIFNKDFVELILPDNDLDLAIGNVPFGPAVYDPKYPKLKAEIHDYFFVKALDKVKPGGVVAFITSTGTMDKVSSTVRNILASKADLVGAFRLPSNAFKANAGTDVTTDLIFLQKRAPGQQPKGESWLTSSEVDMESVNGNGTEKLGLNEYFQRHPENMLGKLVASKAMYGNYRPTLQGNKDVPFAKQLAKALQTLPKGIMLEGKATGQAPAPVVFAPDNIQEHQYVVKDGKLLQRIDGQLVAPAVLEGKDGAASLTKMQRIKEMVALRDKYNDLLMDMNTLPDTEAANDKIAAKRAALLKQYEGFTKKNGLLNSPSNGIFREDPHYPRLLSLESYNRDTKIGTPADVFQRRTIFPPQPLKSLSSDPTEALQQVLSERGYPDIALMAQLTGKPATELAEALGKTGLIYRNPTSGAYETREKYLSGYVRDKLDDAKSAVAQGMKEYAPNVAALEKALPPDVKIGSDPAVSIAVRLGATWIPTEAIEDFIKDAFKSPGEVTYRDGTWKVSGVRPTAQVTNVYGTKGSDADFLLQQTLNQKLTVIKDKEGKTMPDETTAAQAMQEKLRVDFQKFAVESSKWAPKLEKAYNYAYNNLAHTEYDGSHLTFPGMIRELGGKPFALKPHQVNAIWRILQDGRALLAHEVGAGKTFEMAAAIMESRRLGIFKKPMLTVPNHIVEQFRSEFMTLYPGANLLVPTDKDFDAKNRQRIMSQIATGDYDAVILPHSQFNLLDISPERQKVTIQGQLDELEETIRSVTESEGKKSRTVKEMEKARLRLEAKMKALSDLKADKAIYFDHTGVDALFVDEAHQFKNLAFYTKMTRVAGIQQANSKSALRLKMKTEFLQDRNNGRGVIFATGTPIQNTMAELPTMIKYVAPDVLLKAGIRFFDDWAANFGATISAMELSPDGRSFKVRTKFAQFQNVPELMQMFRAFADIKTADDLDLDTPEMEGGKPSLVTVPASDAVSEYISGLMERAEKLKTGGVDPKDDNMLKITSEGRKAATDMRLLNPHGADDPGSKINHAVNNLYKEWKDGTGVTLSDGSKADLTQMAFLDMYRYVDPETEEEKLNLYEDMRNKLVKAGVPREQIALIGEHEGRVKRQLLFNRVNKGEVRILFGSTQMMGAGTNAQKLLKALHHIDLPWRPGDVAQRNGRIIRQGNRNDSVRIYNYLTAKSFDAYMAQTLESKATFIAQTMSGKSDSRTMTDAAADSVLSFEEMKIAASGNPDVRRKYDLEMQQARLASLKRTFAAQQQSARRAVDRERNFLAGRRAAFASTKETADKINAVRGEDGKGFAVTIDGKAFPERKQLMDYLEKMDVPQGNFYLTWNGVGVSVKTMTDRAGYIPMPTLAYTLPYTDQDFEPTERTMPALARSIEARLRDIQDAVENQASFVRQAEERLAGLEKVAADTSEWPEQAELDKVRAELKEVQKRLGLGDVNAGSQAAAEAVAAEAGADEDEDDEEEGEDSLDTTEDDKPAPRKPGGVTMRGSFFGVDIAAEAAAKVIKVAWQKDIAPHLPALGANLKEAASTITHTIAPTYGANRDVMDSLMKLKGDQEKSLFHIEKMFEGVEKMFDSIPEEARIDFLDRYKTGKAQGVPELQKLADLYKTVDTQTYRAIVDAQIGGMDKATRNRWAKMSPAEKADFYDELQAGKSFAQPGDEEKAADRDKEAQMRLKLQEIADAVLSFKADHFRVFWKTIPGTGETRTMPQGKRGPLRGDRGMLKRSTLPDISTGIERGGVPVTTNPQKLFEMAQSSSLRYITAQNMWKELGDLGMRKFVAKGDLAPEGWDKVNDAIAKVYFPARVLKDDLRKIPDDATKGDIRTRTTPIETGEWCLEKSAARLLNNYLSRDWFKTNAIGRGLLTVKNFSTAIELSLSPFHAVFETLEAMGSQFGLGAMRAWNLGLRKGDGQQFLDGLKESASAPIAPFTIARAGGSAIKATASYKEFLATQRGRDFIRAFPNAPHLVDLYFQGGGVLGQPREFRVTMMEGARAALTDGNYLGAFARALPGLSQLAMKPLFETYIPRLKLGFFLKSMSEQLAEKQDELKAGDTTEAEIARDVVNATENRFGELNFSNLWWENTFKGAAQLAFRSVTWKLGNWRGAGNGVVGQAQAFADPLKTMYDDFKGNRKGADRKAAEYIPKLDLNMSWLLGMVVTTSVISTIVSKLLTDKYPWQWAEEAERHGKSFAGELALELMHPRTGGVDSYTGLPTRLSLPTGARDFEHAAEDPRGYLHGSLSGFVGKAWDTWDNKDFFGNYVYDPNGTEYQKLASILSYNTPLPITVQQLRDGHKAHDYTKTKLGLLGMSKASTSLDMTPLQKHMEGIARAKHIPQTPEERQAYKDKIEEIRAGGMKGKDARQAMKEFRKPYLIRLFQKLNYAEARNAYMNFADDEEKKFLRPALMRKREYALSRNPSSIKTAETPAN